MSNNKEQKVRRALNMIGYGLRKSRSCVSIDNLGEYMVYDLYSNAVVLGSRFEYTLDDIAEWLAEK